MSSAAQRLSVRPPDDGGVLLSPVPIGVGRSEAQRPRLSRAPPAGSGGGRPLATGWPLLATAQVYNLDQTHMRGLLVCPRRNVDPP
jgi:hypothetical protein